MGSYAASDRPEEFRNAHGERGPDPEPDDPGARAEDLPHQSEFVGNAWLLLGILLLVAVGVLMLLIFASGGKADSSMML